MKLWHKHRSTPPPQPPNPWQQLEADLLALCAEAEAIAAAILAVPLFEVPEIW